MEQTILKPKNLSPELQNLRAAALWLNSITGRPPKLHVIAIGDRDVFLEARTIHDLEDLASVDILSEWPPYEAGPKSRPQQSMRLLADNPPPNGAPPLPLETMIANAYQNDPLALEIHDALRLGARYHRSLSLVD